MGALAEYQEKFKRLIVNRIDDRPSPHKICMLLAVLDLARAGAIRENRIEFSPSLLERYNLFFAAVRGARDHPNPYFPFFHLSGRLRGGEPSFWHLKPLPGRESVLAALQTARSVSDITDNIAFVELDDRLFVLLSDPDAVETLAETATTHWLRRGFDELLRVVSSTSRASNYERKIRRQVDISSEPLPPPFVRDPAFRRVVTEVYDYRCAATGLRIVLPSGEAMVEAAHIHPFAAAGDDDPRNGIALSPDMHWAMDKYLIAPGLDLKWHVSSELDDRVPDFRTLLALDGRPLLMPREMRYAPKAESLSWRLGKLRGR